jgi:acyl carrier protein
MCGMMEEQYEIEVSPGEVFNNPSVAALSAHIAQRISERSATV